MIFFSYFTTLKLYKHNSCSTVQTVFVFLCYKNTNSMSFGSTFFHGYCHTFFDECPAYFLTFPYIVIVSTDKCSASSCISNAFTKDFLAPWYQCPPDRYTGLFACKHEIIDAVVYLWFEHHTTPMSVWVGYASCDMVVDYKLLSAGL